MTTDNEHIANIARQRFERGAFHAETGRAPVEANAEYQAGYMSVADAPALSRLLDSQKRANGMQEQLMFALEECDAKDKRIAQLEHMLRENLGKDEEVARLSALNKRYLKSVCDQEDRYMQLQLAYEKRGQAFKRRRKLIATLEGKIRKLEGKS